MINPEFRSWWCSHRWCCDWRRVSVSLLQSGKCISESAPLRSAKVPHFWSKEVYFIQIPSGAFTFVTQVRETKNIFSGIVFFFILLRLIRIHHLEVLHIEMNIKISFDFQKPFTMKAEGISIISSCGSYHLGILLIKHCFINKQIMEVSTETVDLNHDSCSFIFVLTRQ